MGVRQALLSLIGNAKQATGRKSGPVETRLTGPVATALLTTYGYINHKSLYKLEYGPYIYIVQF